MAFHSAAGIAAAYDVFSVNSDGLVVKSINALGAKTSGQTIEITGTQDVRLTVTIAKTSASIKGVALREGKPVPGVVILLVPADFEHNLSLFRQAQSDSDGTFSCLMCWQGNTRSSRLKTDGIWTGQTRRCWRPIWLAARS